MLRPGKILSMIQLSISSKLNYLHSFENIIQKIIGYYENLNNKNNSLTIFFLKKNTVKSQVMAWQ